MLTRAYWIFPDNTILEVSSHHMTVIKSPEEFGETTQTIHDTYEKYGERLGLEGKARDEILTRVIKRRFIRIREMKNSWSIQVWQLTDIEMDSIRRWARKVYDEIKDKFAPIKVTEVSKGGSLAVIYNSFNELFASGSKKEEKGQGEK